MLLSKQHNASTSGGPRVVVSTARARGSVPSLSGLKETKKTLPRVKVSIVGSLRDREVACSASDRQGRISNPVSSQSSHHPQEVLLAQFSLYVHKGGIKPHLFLFYEQAFGKRFTYKCHRVFQHLTILKKCCPRSRIKIRLVIL